jgi:hypothetical protein
LWSAARNALWLSSLAEGLHPNPQRRCAPTGANFALVPRNISSGEFTRVVQRVPVRILVEKDERWPQLRAGLSVTVAIAHGPGDPEWAKQAADDMRNLETTVKPSRD